MADQSFSFKRYFRRTQRLGYFPCHHSAHPDLLLSGSRDKTLIKWKLTGGEDNQYGIPKKSFKGHSHIVQDVTISADGAYALSASWDRTLRLWDLETGETTQRFVGHKGDVLSVSIAKNLRQIVSASRDKTVKVWNTIGECMATLTGHNDWVSAVRISPSDQSSTVISASWDKTVKVCYSLFVLFFLSLSFIIVMIFFYICYFRRCLPASNETYFYHQDL